MSTPEFASALGSLCAGVRPQLDGPMTPLSISLLLIGFLASPIGRGADTATPDHVVLGCWEIRQILPGGASFPLRGQVRLDSTSVPDRATNTRNAAIVGVAPMEGDSVQVSYEVRPPATLAIEWRQQGFWARAGGAIQGHHFQGLMVIGNDFTDGVLVFPVIGRHLRCVRC